MSPRVDELAEEIASLDESIQDALWQHVAELNLRRGLRDLTERYRERLRARGELARSAAEIADDMGRVREEIAARDYAR